MTVEVACPECDHRLYVPERALGRRVNCPSCYAKYTLKAEFEELPDDEPPPIPENRMLWPWIAAVATLAMVSLILLALLVRKGRAPAEPAPVVAKAEATPNAAETTPPTVGPAPNPNLAPAETAAPDEPPIAAAIAAPDANPAQPPQDPNPNPDPPPAPAPAVQPSLASADGGKGTAEPESSLPEPDPEAAANPLAEAATPDPANPVPAGPLSVAEIVDRCEPSVALVLGKKGQGTGFIVRPGLLATNAHVIEGEIVQDIRVRFPSAKRGLQGPYSAELVFQDRDRDLAFLAVKSTLPPLPLVPNYKLRKGEEVIAIGNPGLGFDGGATLENAVSRGIMSTKLVIEGENFYQVSIAINPGNSGGPVLDLRGQVIGVITRKVVGEGKEGLAFCIPGDELASEVDRADRMARGMQARKDAKKAGAAAEADPTAPALDYGWKIGWSYAYRVQVDIETDSSLVSLDGSSIYTVSALEKGEFRLLHKGIVNRKTIARGGPNDQQRVISNEPGQPTEGELFVDRKGKLGKVELRSPVSLLGDLSLLVIEPLPERPQNRWEITQDSSLTLQRAVVRREGQGGPAPPINMPDLLNPGGFGNFGGLGGFGRPNRPNFGPFGPRPGGINPGFPRMPRLPQQPQADVGVETITLPASEQSIYTVEKSDEAPRIRKEYTFETKDQIKGSPLLRLSGRGTISFDPDQHIPGESTFKGNISAHGEPKRAQIGLRMVSKLLTGQEHASTLAAAGLGPLDPEPEGPIGGDDAPDERPANRSSRYKPGLIAEYFADPQFRQRTVSRIDRDINFTWGDGSPDPAVPKDDFSARWTGYLQAPKAGTYVLRLESDNGTRFIMGKRVLYDSLSTNGWHDKQVTVELTDKPTPLRLEFMEGIFTSWCRLSWRRADGAEFEPIPESCFCHTRN